MISLLFEKTELFLQLIHGLYIRHTKVRKDFKHIQFSYLAMQKLIEDYKFDIVLDVGCGEGVHAEIFNKYNKKVTAIDYGNSKYFKKKESYVECIVADINEYEFNTQFDCIWCSHVLEHQLNVNKFLTKLYRILKDGGILAVTVPPMKNQIVGGHVSIWNAGLVLYNLVLSGFNCKYASIRQYGYNISIILEKQKVLLPENLSYDYGDINKLKNYLPNGLNEPFNGNIKKLNW